jgi:Ca2+/Na+ antiporter
MHGMDERTLTGRGQILAFAAIVEVGTGLALMLDPALVAALLVGAELASAGNVLGRWAGVVLVALGLACWPGPLRAEGGSAAFRAMVTYNSLTALYLAYLGTAGHLGGILLWPGVALHAVVAMLLIWTRRDGGAEIAARPPPP